MPAASVSGSSPEFVLQQDARKGSQRSFQERVLVLIAHGYPPFTLVEPECWLIVEEGMEHRLLVASLGEMPSDSLQQRAPQSVSLSARINREQADHRSAGGIGRHATPRGGCKDESIDLFSARRNDPSYVSIELRPGSIRDTTDGTTVAHSARIDPQGDALLDVRWRSGSKSECWISVVFHRVSLSDATACKPEDATTRPDSAEVPHAREMGDARDSPARVINGPLRPGCCHARPTQHAQPRCCQRCCHRPRRGGLRSHEHSPDLGGPGGDRTLDPRIKSPMLYH